MLGRHHPNTRSKSRAVNIAPNLSVRARNAENRPHGPVTVSTFNLLRHRHRRCNDHKWYVLISSPDNQTRAYWQVPLWPSVDGILNRSFNLRTEESSVPGIYPAIHKSITVGRRDDAMPRHCQQIALLNRNLREWFERVYPSIDQAPIEIDEV